MNTTDTSKTEDAGEQHADSPPADLEALAEFNRALQRAIDGVDWSQPF
jgi:hypothetical protein